MPLAGARKIGRKRGRRRCGLVGQEDCVVDAVRNDLQDRTKAYALDVARFAKTLLSRNDVRHAAGQLLRSSASVAANYRAVCLARSRKEFVAKLGVVIEEADEAVFWLEYITAQDDGLKSHEIAGLKSEGLQLLWIFKASRQTARRNDEGPR
jgi:four helix bundle protein